MMEAGLYPGDLQPQDLPLGFQFSQGSLQDFVDCRRRFQLRYIQGVAWPALQTEPAMQNERAMRQGARFHHLVHQHLLGVPASLLANLAQGDDLGRWWQSYLRHVEGLLGSAGKLYPEITLSAPFGEHRLLAKYDLVIAGEAGHFTIIDWKTSARRPRRAWLAERLQTRVYPYLLAHAGKRLGGGEALHPGQIEMLYWFAGHPDLPERFTYSPEQHRENHEYLSTTLDEIERRTRLGDFPLTNDDNRCAFCVYRSLCDRGARAGALDEWEGVQEADEIGIAVDFEHIPEIEF
ncbi:MAG: PD-(D/E)XK nuclease family protein [Anaerolineales bacterium]|nr:PD-(D/E)XK nuclease family protein [Anaerolineales bacterium]